MATIKTSTTTMSTRYSMSTIIVQKSLATNLARKVAVIVAVKICNFHAKVMAKNNTKINRSKRKTKTMKRNSSEKCTTAIIFASGSKSKQSRGRSYYIVFLRQEIVGEEPKNRAKNALFFWQPP